MNLNIKNIKNINNKQLLIISAILIGIIVIGVGIVVYIPKNNSTGNNTNQTIHEVRFIVVGDPHIKSSKSNSDRGNQRLGEIVNFIDTSNVDFVVVLGDITDDGKDKTFDVAKKILQNLTKPYYVVPGNHDIFQTPREGFESYFGPMEHIEKIKGYQLLFAGISDEKVGKKVKLHWFIDFNKTDKNAPTLLFMHGPTVSPPEGTSCDWGADFFGYGQSMQPELNTFPNFIAEYTGHVHYDTDQIINSVTYVTVNGLVDKAGGCENEGASPYVGYSVVKDGKAEFKLVDYSKPFQDPFPD